LPLQIHGENHPVFLGGNLLDATGRVLKELELNSPILVITDSRVNKLYGDRLKSSLHDAGLASNILEIPRGEGVKNLEQVKILYRMFLDYNLDRNSTVIALGGGVITDLTGFAASTFMRGINLVLIPTTLLAQVDAGVGGKTGVNLPEGKNLVGTFYFPRGVLVDPQLLSTLEEKEFAFGIPEVIKSALIASPELLDLIEEHLNEIKSQSGELLNRIIKAALEIKLAIVQLDPLETRGQRMFLNFGHTLGHAFEASGHYKIYSHGEAVGLGMLCAGYLSEQLLGLPSSITERTKKILAAFGLPIKLSILGNPEIYKHLQRDKKKQQTLRMVLLEQIGKPRINELPAHNQLEAVLDRLRQEK